MQGRGDALGTRTWEDVFSLEGLEGTRFCNESGRDLAEDKDGRGLGRKHFPKLGPSTWVGLGLARATH